MIFLFTAIKELNGKAFLQRPVAIDWAVSKDRFQSENPKPREKSEPEAGPAPKKSKIDESCSSSTSKGPLDQYVTVKSKIPLEDLVAREAVKGATFRYLASSYLIKKGLCALGFQDEAPNHHTSVSKLVDKSAENHRAKLCEHLKNLAEKGQKFCAITDEWTCPGKKKRYINVSLHLKGNFDNDII